jgi:threonine/homoserine/homoserine lactone efflux protein
LASSFGTAIGGMLHVFAAALGLSLVVAQSAVAFNLVKYLGAVYLVYLGIRLLLRADQRLRVKPVASEGVRHALFEEGLKQSRPRLSFWRSCLSSSRQTNRSFHSSCCSEAFVLRSIRSSA